MENLQLSVAEIHFWCSEISQMYNSIFFHEYLLCAHKDLV